jgi:hypothetical protein
MQKISSKITTALALGWAALAITPVPVLSDLAQGGQAVPFKATFHGFAAAPTPTDEPNVVEIIVPLHGEGTHLGAFDELLVHHLNLATGAFTGHADWTAANGDTFTTVFEGQIHPTDDPAWVTFNVTHTLVKGTGRFNGATASFEGINGRFNLVTGEDQGGYSGTISY